MEIALWYALFHIGSILTVLLIMVLASRILRSSRMPAVTIGWLLAIIFMPLLSIPLYLVLGERKIKFKLNNKEKLALQADNKSSPHTVLHPIHSLIVSMNFPSASKNNESQFHEDGKASWFSLTTLIKEARSSIDIAMFILGKDAVGQEVISLLEQKAAEGVKIRLLLDGVGTFSFTKKRFKPLIRNGAKIAWFIPVIRRPYRGRTNLRNHRKIVIADHSIVWSGGRNLSSDYLGPDCSSQCWVDMSFVQKGPIVASYLEIFESDWAFAAHEKSVTTIHKIEIPNKSYKNTSELQLIPSGPDVQGDPIYSVILTACYGSKRQIMIATPYYIPDENIQKALKLAALRGVTVDLLVPEKSNHRLADIARNRALRELINTGVNVWHLPKMIHAKVMIVDEDFAMAGSANLDIRSLFLNYELMSVFYSSHDIAWLSKWFESLREASKLQQIKTVSATTELIEGLALLSAYQL